MPRKRLSMRKVNEVLRLFHMAGVSQNEIAGAVGLAVVNAIIEVRPHPEQGYRSSLGLLRLEKAYGRARLEQACQRALHFGLLTRRHVMHILENKQDLISIAEEDEAFGSHANVRGADFYH